MPTEPGAGAIRSETRRCPRPQPPERVVTGTGAAPLAGSSCLPLLLDRVFETSGMDELEQAGLTVRIGVVPALVADREATETAHRAGRSAGRSAVFVSARQLDPSGSGREARAVLGAWGGQNGCCHELPPSLWGQGHHNLGYLHYLTGVKGADHDR